MKNYVGIDLGTTNSAICSYDGESLRLYKSPDQNDVTPSAIYIDRRGNRYFGKRAYDSAPHSPDNAATLFKRLMGTATPIRIPAAGLTLTPEQCSAEILRVLYGYLPEELRNNAETGTVITVPAAFNLMQKEATLAAAEMAGIGRVAVMQEPVAAIMSVMRARKTDGVFLVFDLGGGTLDVALAQSISGRVTLLAHGGVAMCGGRDFDLLLVENVVKPWLLDTFDLPAGFAGDPEFKTLVRLAAWAAEKAKIELSTKEEAVISLSEDELRTRDKAGKDIFLDIPLSRRVLNPLIESKIAEAVKACRATLDKGGLSSGDVERIAFVGGPTHYSPLRERISAELGIPGTSDLNPMTAVAEGAALFAESIDWTSERRGRKSSRGAVSLGGKLGLEFKYLARTPDIRARITVSISGNALPGTEFQVDSLDSGWSSGRLPLTNGATLDVLLQKNGENTFKVFVFDPIIGPVSLPENRIVIARTAATIDAIPASHSIGVEVLEKLGGRSTLVYLVRAGEPLPKKGRHVFKAGESLRAGGGGSINLKIWEGEALDPPSDNRFVGVLKINGSDFENGAIGTGADLVCDFAVLDSGNVVLEVSVPSIGATFHSARNFYSRQEAQIDLTAAAAQIADESALALHRVEEVASQVEDSRLDEARQKLEGAVELEPNETDPETCKQMMDNVLEARRLLAEVRRTHQSEIRQLDLDQWVTFFNERLRQYAKPTEIGTIESLIRTAQRAIDRSDRDFENHLDELRGRAFEILWRQDWFVISRFEAMQQEPHLFRDTLRFRQLVAEGQAAARGDDMERLRAVVGQLISIRIRSTSEDEMLESVNVIRS